MSEIGGWPRYRADQGGMIVGLQRNRISSRTDRRHHVPGDRRAATGGR